MLDHFAGFTSAADGMFKTSVQLSQTSIIARPEPRGPPEIIQSSPLPAGALGA